MKPYDPFKRVIISAPRLESLPGILGRLASGSDNSLDGRLGSGACHDPEGPKDPIIRYLGFG